MSNNPPLPPPNMDDFEATMIREENPLAQPGVFKVGDKYARTPLVTDEQIRNLKPAKPRRAKPDNMIWTYIALGAWFAIAGFIGAFLGTLAANIL